MSDIREPDFDLGCADYTCRYNVNNFCQYDSLWNKQPEGHDCCDGYHTFRDVLARRLRKKRGRVMLVTSHSSSFDYVSRQGLLFDCISRGKSFHEYGYDDPEDEDEC